MATLAELVGKDVEPVTSEDHSGGDYIRDGKTLAIYMSGHYTVLELQYKLRHLVEACKVAGVPLTDE